MLRIHAIQTGTVGIKSKQLRGEGHGAMRLLRDRIGSLLGKIIAHQ